MSLINGTYFDADLKLPNGQYSNNQKFIDEYEPKFLRFVFGHELAALVADYDGSAGVITDLVDGKSYVNDDVNVKYAGIKKAIACFVYYHIMEHNHTHTANVGEVKPKQENSMIATPYYKMVSAWRQMHEILCGGDKYNVSVLDYLKQNMESYPTWEVDMFIDLGNLNSFGV